MYRSFRSAVMALVLTLGLCAVTLAQTGPITGPANGPAAGGMETEQQLKDFLKGIASDHYVSIRHLIDGKERKLVGELYHVKLTIGGQDYPMFVYSVARQPSVTVRIPLTRIVAPQHLPTLRFPDQMRWESVDNGYALVATITPERSKLGQDLKPLLEEIARVQPQLAGLR